MAQLYTTGTIVIVGFSVVKFTFGGKKVLDFFFSLVRSDLFLVLPDKFTITKKVLAFFSLVYQRTLLSSTVATCMKCPVD